MSTRLRTPTLMRAAGALAMAVLVLAATSAHAETPTPIKPVTDHVKVAGQDVKVDRYGPTTDAKKCPALVMLHAVDGLEEFGNIYANLADRFAHKGYVVFIVHYFDRSKGLPKEELAALKEKFRVYFNPKVEKKPADLKAMGQHFADWTETVREAVKYAGQLERVDRQRIGLTGFSLGGALSLAVAAHKESEVAAVVSLFGGRPPELLKGVERFPPVLIVHGDADAIVPPTEAEELAKELKAKKVPCELVMYPKRDHLFRGSALTDMLKDLQDAEQRAAEFFKTHLKPDTPDKPKK